MVHPFATITWHSSARYKKEFNSLAILQWIKLWGLPEPINTITFFFLICPSILILWGVVIFANALQDMVGFIYSFSRVCSWCIPSSFDISCSFSSSSWVIVEISEGLMGVELFFLGGNLEPNTDIYASICPLNHFKLIFQTKVMKILKKYTHFSYFLGVLYWICCISVTVDLKYLKLRLAVALWVLFLASQVWSRLDSPRKSYAKSPTVT